jgi:hypothetical protein
VVPAMAFSKSALAALELDRKAHSSKVRSFVSWLRSGGWYTSSLWEIEQISSTGSSINPSEWSQTVCHQRQRGLLCGSRGWKLPIQPEQRPRSPGARQKSSQQQSPFFRLLAEIRSSGWMGSFHRLNISPLISQVESQIPIAFGEHSCNVYSSDNGGFLRDSQ